MKDEHWLLERYHPVEIERRSVDASRAARNRSNVFCSTLPADVGSVPKFDSVPTSPSQPLGASNVVLVQRVGAVVSSEALQRFFETVGGVQELTIGAPDPAKRFTRTAYVTADSAESAQRMVAELEGKGLGGELLALSLAPQTLPPSILPAIASTPLRLARDLQNAMSLADALDTEAGMLSRGWRVEQGTDAARLDVFVEYLREVHLYSYFNWTQCETMGQLRATCPVFYRSVAAGSAAGEEGVDARGDAWAQTLDFQASARSNRAFNASLRTGRAEADKAVAALQNRNCQPDGEGRSRCVECRKVFLTPDFVFKHFLNKHGDLVERCRAIARGEQCFRNYFSDNDRVVLEEELTETERPAPQKDSQQNQQQQPEESRRPTGFFVAPPSAPDPRAIRSYSEVVNAPTVFEEELDYRLM